jgi:hypothetical protein
MMLWRAIFAVLMLSVLAFSAHSAGHERPAPAVDLHLHAQLA